MEGAGSFGRACEKLGIEIITAYSVQAKGRVERRYGVFQDRFVEDLNHRFIIPAIDPQDAHVKIHRRVGLWVIFCFEETRTVSNEWVVRYYNRYFQLLVERRVDIRPKKKVTVAQ